MATAVSHHQSARFDGWIARLPPRWRWAAGALRLTLRDPADGWDRARVRVSEAFGASRSAGHGYVAQADWHLRLHRGLGLPWPCAATPAFEQVWDAMRGNGLSVGRGKYGGWDDGDPGLARAIWCLTTHLRPATVVETGVARGITSRVILEALTCSGSGHLWSVDLPAMDPSLHEEIGIAVPNRLYPRWTYVSGTSRRRLPGLLSDLGAVDLFVHDSSHTERNVRFELHQAWQAVRRGAVVADDIQQSRAFAAFAEATPDAKTIVAAADDAKALFGVALKGFG